MGKAQSASSLSLPPLSIPRHLWGVVGNGEFWEVSRVAGGVSTRKKIAELFSSIRPLLRKSEGQKVPGIVTIAPQDAERKMSIFT